MVHWNFLNGIFSSFSQLTCLIAIINWRFLNYHVMMVTIDFLKFRCCWISIIISFRIKNMPIRTRNKFVSIADRAILLYIIYSNSTKYNTHYIQSVTAHKWSIFLILLSYWNLKYNSTYTDHLLSWKQITYY